MPCNKDCSLYTVYWLSPLNTLWLLMSWLSRRPTSYAGWLDLIPPAADSATFELTRIRSSRLPGSFCFLTNRSVIVSCLCRVGGLASKWLVKRQYWTGARACYAPDRPLVSSRIHHLLIYLAAWQVSEWRTALPASAAASFFICCRRNILVPSFVSRTWKLWCLAADRRESDEHMQVFNSLHLTKQEWNFSKHRIMK